jgi:CO/xanthine dehydrogenase Mo-binding subunit
MQRRQFLQIGLWSGGALCLGFSLGGCGGGQEKRMRALAKQTGALKPNAMIAVGRDSRVTLGVGKAEMGQGVTTGYAMLVAEELGVPLDRVDFEFVNGPAFASMGLQFTGGSTSLAEGFVPVREAAATAREMLIAAAAKGWGVPARDCDVDGGAVVHAASGKTTSIGELTVAAAAQSIPEDPKLRDPKTYKIIGKRGIRRDVEAKVRGAAGFGIDVTVPGMVCAAMIHPPVWGARAERVDAEIARAMTGVIDVFATRYGVAVVADKYWQASRAAEKVEVTWGRGQLEGYNTEDVLADALGYRGHGKHVRDDGDVDRRHEGGKSLEVSYQFPYLAHATMEPQNCTVKVEGGRVEVWAPTQSPTILSQTLAAVAGVDRGDVTVHTTFLGGGFGRRFASDWAAQACAIAMRVKRPVKLIWSRESDTRGGWYRPITVTRCRGTVAGGKLVSYDQHTIGQPITGNLDDMFGAAIPDFMPKMFSRLMTRSSLALFSTNSVPDIVASEGAADTHYTIPNLRVRYTPINVKVPVLFWRSVGHSYNGFAVESFVDEAAHAAGADPLEFRLAHLKEGSRERAVLEAVAAAAGWGKTAATPGYAFGVAQHKSFGSYAAQVVEAGVVDGEIRVRRVWCVIDCGIAVSPDVIRGQMESGIIYGLSAALWQEITFRDGRIEQGNFDTYRIMRMSECPEISVQIIDSTEKPTGVGEPGLPPVGPATANAIFAGTGVRLRRLPLQRAWDERRGNGGSR